MATPVVGLKPSKRIAPVFDLARLRRLHLEPTRGRTPGIAPGVSQAGGDQTEIAGAERVSHLSDFHRDVAFENVEAFFERVQVQLDGAPWVQKTDTRAHMDRSYGAIHVRSAAETGAVLLVKRGSLRGGWVDLGDSVHGKWIYYLRYGRRREGASRKLTVVNRIVTQMDTGVAVPN
jgi:hypothetical protein